MGINRVGRYGWQAVLLLCLLVLLGLLWQGLVKERVVAPLTKSLPAFYLADIRQSKRVSIADLKGQVSVLHVWATWCPLCLKEHAQWVAIKKQSPYPLVGVAFRDDVKTVLALLKDQGDPYTYLLDDQIGSLGIGLGIVGTPETFIIDKDGKVQFHYQGPVSVAIFEQKFLPVLQQLKVS